MPRLDDIEEPVEDEAEEGDIDTSPPRILIPTGSTMLNLALSDRVDGGWGAGRIANVPGASSSGKTLIALNTIAEIAHTPRFDDWRCIYDPAESGLEFDVAKLFGQKTADRMEFPEVDKDGEPVASGTIQDFHANVYDALDDGRPFIYVLDSLDGVTSNEENEHTKEVMAARKTGKKVSGTYGMEKAKMLTAILRQIHGRLKKTNSALLILSQVRDDPNPMSRTHMTRAGGRALRFYSMHEAWMSVTGTLRGGASSAQIGVESCVKLKKNRLTGKLREVDFPIYYSYGIDDMGSCIDWLLKVKWWEGKGTAIQAGEFSSKPLSRSALIKLIDSDPDMLAALKRVVGKAWASEEAKLVLNRTPRYA